MESLSPSSQYKPQGLSAASGSSSEWYEIIADPACYAIVAFLRNKETHNIHEFKKQLPADLFELFDSIVGYLERCGMIEIHGSEIKLLQKNFLSIFDHNSHRKFLPNLNQEATKIVLRNVNGSVPGNDYRFFSIDRNEKSLARVRKAVERFVGELNAIAEEAGPSSDPTKKQFISLINTQISLEDFI